MSRVSMFDVRASIAMLAVVSGSVFCPETGVAATPQATLGDCHSVIGLSQFWNAVDAVSPKRSFHATKARMAGTAVRGDRLLGVVGKQTNGAPAAVLTAYQNASALLHAFALGVRRASTSKALSHAFTAWQEGEYKTSASVIVVTYLLQRCTSAISRPTTTGALYTAAQAQWEAEGLVGGGAAQSLPLIIGATDLQRVVDDEPTNTAYVEALAAFYGLEGVPDAMVTPAQNRLGDVAIRALKKFFGSGWGDTVPMSPAIRAAFRAWEREPARFAQGIKRAPLRTAISTLTQSSRRHPRARYYAAIIDDLESLATAPEHVTGRTANGIYGYEADFINTVFAESVGLRGNVRFVLQS